ncbi:MAG: HD domain-containing protein [Candidatus Gracilibacteria bacterium]|nr:HD domain-containing protein [Candidatus Gracilibacteria bacterium]
METINKNTEGMKKPNITYIIKVVQNDGTTIYPVYISGDDSKVAEAVDYFSNLYRNDGIVETVIDDTLLNSQELVSWESIKKSIFENTNSDNVGKLLKDLDKLGVGAWFIDLMRKDLQVEDNKKLLLTYLDVSGFSEDEKEKIKLAVDICLEAHEGQTQKRPQDLDGLDDIPYSNHPIVVALIGIRDLKMSAEEIQACLLHDVIEDTEFEKEKLEEHFSEEVINMVQDCSRNENETREQFMSRMKGLKGGSKIIKCLDRFHNIIRAFSIKDPKYISRIINETKEVYLPAFESLKELEPIKTLFFDLLEELEKYHEKIS